MVAERLAPVVPGGRSLCHASSWLSEWASKRIRVAWMTNIRSRRPGRSRQGAGNPDRAPLSRVVCRRALGPSSVYEWPAYADSSV